MWPRPPLAGRATTTGGGPPWGIIATIVVLALFVPQVPAFQLFHVLIFMDPILKVGKVSYVLRCFSLSCIPSCSVFSPPSLSNFLVFLLLNGYISTNLRQENYDCPGLLLVSNN